MRLVIAALNSLVSESIDLVVHAERGPAGPRVMSVLAVEEQTSGADAVQFTTTEVFARDRYDAELRPTGQVPIRAGRRLERIGVDVRDLVLDEAVRR